MLYFFVKRRRRLYARVKEDGIKKIEKKPEKGGYKNLSRYLSNKAINKKIIENDFGDMNERLSLLKYKLNHIVILCHQGVIDTVNMTLFLAEMRLIHKFVSNGKVIEIKND